MSGVGFFYDKYGEDFSYFTLQKASVILSDVTREYLEILFDKKFLDDEFEEIMDIYHDEIYDNSLTYEFFSYETPVKFTGIGEIKLSQL